MRKRTLSGLVGALGIAAALAGCGGSSSTHNSRAQVRTTVASVCKKAPASGGSLVYDRGYETETLNPISIRNGNGDIFADAMIYQGLVQYNPNGSPNPVGGVASSWSVSGGGKIYTFHIRRGLKFSNGQPVTAQDVKFSLDRFGDTKVNQVMSVVAVGYGSSTIVNPSTVRITLAKPVAAFLDNIAIFPAFIVPKKLVEREGNSFWSHPIGSGPFKLQSFVSGSHVAFVRNPLYWDRPLPYLHAVTFNFATDADSRLLALTSGAAQEADEITPSQVATIQSRHKLVLQSNTIPGWVSLYPNESFKPFANVKVRQALAYAINRQAINSEIFHGLGQVPNSILGHFALDAGPRVVPAYSYSPTKARQLLAAARYAKGFKVTLQYPSGFDYFNQMTLLIKQELAAVGITVKLAEQAPSAVTANFSARTYELSFGYPENTSDIAVPDEFASFEALANSTNGFFTGWSDPKIRAAVSTFVAEQGAASRARDWPRIQAAFMQQQPEVNVLDQPLLSAHAADVCGTQINDLGVDQLWHTWIARG